MDVRQHSGTDRHGRRAEHPLIAPDTNILLYAYDERSRWHSRAAAYLESIFSRPEPVGLPLPCVHAFVRLITNPVISGKRISLESALGNVNEWLTFPNVQILFPGDRHWELLKRLSAEGHAAGNLFPDAVIAAIALEYGATIHTNDRDFARFPGLRWHNPLQS